eukprot:m.300874 g.300874  ORF g.300874 m.300874 type:complete len:677 (+) comp15876_c0_seq5:995-3025(+)
MQINCSYATIMSRQLDFSEPESIYPRFGTSTTDEAFEVYDLGGETGQTVPRGTRGEVAINDNQPSPPSVTTSTPSQQESRFASYGGELLYSSIPDERLYQEPQPVDRTLPVQDQVQQLEAIVSSLRNVLKQSQPLPGVPAHETKGVSPLPSLTQKPNQTFILPRLWKILCLVALFVSLASLALAVVVLTGSGSSTDSSSPSASSGLGALESKLSLLNTTFQQHLTAYNQHVSQFSSTISGLQLRVGVLESSTGSPSPSPTPSPSPPSPPSIDVQDIRDDLTNLEAIFSQFQTYTKQNISALSQLFNIQDLTDLQDSFSQFQTETKRNISSLDDSLSTSETKLSEIEQSIQVVRSESFANNTQSSLLIASVVSSIDTLRQESVSNFSTASAALTSLNKSLSQQSGLSSDYFSLVDDTLVLKAPNGVALSSGASYHLQETSDGWNVTQPFGPPYICLDPGDVLELSWIGNSGVVEVDSDGNIVSAGWSSGPAQPAGSFTIHVGHTDTWTRYIKSLQTLHVLRLEFYCTLPIKSLLSVSVKGSGQWDHRRITGLGAGRRSDPRTHYFASSAGFSSAVLAPSVSFSNKIIELSGQDERQTAIFLRTLQSDSEFLSYVKSTTFSAPYSTSIVNYLLSTGELRFYSNPSITRASGDLICDGSDSCSAVKFCAEPRCCEHYNC